MSGTKCLFRQIRTKNSNLLSLLLYYSYFNYKECTNDSSIYNIFIFLWQWKCKKSKSRFHTFSTFSSEIHRNVTIRNSAWALHYPDLLVDSNALTHLKFCSPLFSQSKRARGPGKKQISGVRVLSRMLDGQVFIASMLFTRINFFWINIIFRGVYLIFCVDASNEVHFNRATLPKLFPLFSKLIKTICI